MHLFHLVPFNVNTDLAKLYLMALGKRKGRKKEGEEREKEERKKRKGGRREGREEGRRGRGGRKKRRKGWKGRKEGPGKFSLKHFVLELIS